MNNNFQKTSRCVALVGPYMSGKTTLLENLLLVMEGISRKGSAKDKNTVGDFTPEARARSMTAEMSVASLEYAQQRWTFLDCPGSVELSYEMTRALMVADLAIVVCKPEAEEMITVDPILKYLSLIGTPYFLFINKIDQLSVPISTVLEALGELTDRPLVMRQELIYDQGQISGYIDLISERHYRYKSHQASEVIPADSESHYLDARTKLLETLADFDDSLLEQLLEDVIPEKGRIYDSLKEDLIGNKVAPVFFGSAETENGVRRLLKALRHDTPLCAATAERLGIVEEVDSKASSVSQVFKCSLAGHSGKQALIRVWKGGVSEGMEIGGMRIGGVCSLFGGQQKKVTAAEAGDVVALNRIEEPRGGDLLTDNGQKLLSSSWPRPSPPVFALAVIAENRQDEMKFTATLAALQQEDPSLEFEQNTDTHEMLLWGQGEIHLGIALDKIRRHNIAVKSRPPQIPYKETIRQPTAQHSRYKRQSGGHGQFADIHIEIKPQARGEGFAFTDTISGGVIPRQFIPAVKAGIIDYLNQGPLGFPVVDIAVNLSNGQFHSVDSSEMAFKICGRQAMSEAMTRCDPVLLEPIMLVTLSLPKAFTSKLQRLISGRRGQILGFDDKPGWFGWDELKAYIPHAEMLDLIVDLRSLTLGVATFVFQFERFQELTGKLAEQAQIKREQLISSW